MKRALLIALATGLTIAAASRSAAATEPVLLDSASIKWGDVPPAFPRGAKMAVLYGDPSKEGLFIVRLKMPANYTVQAHWHPTDESVTVVSGTCSFGMGDKFDAKQLRNFAAGSFVVAPAKHNHFVTSKKGCTVEVAAMGPFAITYVNPADDPSKKPPAKK
jgi:quercetin dioxygenase-like cupin family protein